jgi:hypothetical protein
MDEYPGLDSKAALILTDSVTEAQRLAAMELKNKEGSGKAAGADDEDNEEQNADMALFVNGKGNKRKANFSH